MRPIVPFVHGLSDEQQALWLETLRAAQPDFEIVPFDQLLEPHVHAAEVAIVANPNPEKLAHLPNLKWVQSLWAGVEKLLPLIAARDLKLARLVDPMLAQTMTEAVLAWTLYLHRDMPRYRQQQSVGHWQQHGLRRANEVVVGILGLGELGRAAANRLQQNGFQVAGWSRSTKQLDGVMTFDGQAGLDEMLAQSDIVVALLPATPQTIGILNHDRLSAMKHGAAIINFARGAILDHDALVAHLDKGHLSHAVLDVFINEPLIGSDPLWQHPKITILPHISAPTDKRSAASQVIETINAWFAQGTTPKFVDISRGY